MRWRTILVTFAALTAATVVVATGKQPSSDADMRAVEFAPIASVAPVESATPAIFPASIRKDALLLMDTFGNTESSPKPSPTPEAGVAQGPIWRWPVRGKLSSYFTSRHPAIDIAGPCGTAIRASRAGTVLFAGWKNNRGGYQVWLGHGTYSSAYYHMSKEIVSSGQKVKQGQVIGYRGSTGHSTGCHLHFEIWKGEPWQGYRLNPLRFL